MPARIALAITILATPPAFVPWAFAQQPISLSHACEIYQSYLAAMRTPVPPTIVIASKAKAMLMTGGVCDQPTNGSEADVAKVAQATNLLAVAMAPYQGAKP